MRTAQAGIRVDPARTLFRTGSVGKLFTWTAVMQQVEAGRLELDRDVNDYLDFRIPPRDGQPVTLRNLMTHTPGFEEAIKRLVTDRPERLASPEEYLKAWVPARIYPPGEVPAYSNYGVTLAGYIVERVSGEALRRLRRPARLRAARHDASTTRQVLPEDFRAQMSQGYMLGSGPAYPFELFGVSPAGGATTTVADMGQIHDRLAAGRRARGAAHPRGGHGAPDARPPGLPIVPPLNSMLLGFFEQGYGGRRIVGHDGDSQYFHSSLNLYPDEGVGVYLVVNSTGRDGAAGTVRASFMSEFADRYFPEKAVEATSVPRTTAAEHVAADGGHLHELARPGRRISSASSAFLSQSRVEARRGRRPARARAAGPERRADEMARSRAVRLAQVGGKERLAARLKDGRVALFSVDSVSPFLVMLPVPWWKSSAIFAPCLPAPSSSCSSRSLAWPATALLRRHYRLWPAHAGAPGRPWRVHAHRVQRAYSRRWLAGSLLFAQLTATCSRTRRRSILVRSPEVRDRDLLRRRTSASALWDACRGWSGRGGCARSGSVAARARFRDDTHVARGGPEARGLRYGLLKPGAIPISDR